MMEEEKASKNAHFLTLTYDQEHVPIAWEGDEAIAYTLEKKDLQTFHQTIKRSQQRKLKGEYKLWPVRFYSVGEYGSRTLRPHYHSIIFNLTDETLNALDRGKMWSKGHIYYGTVTEASCNYVAKYLIDKDYELPDEMQKPFTTMSRNPGIGHAYLEHNREFHRPEYTFNPERWKLYTIKNGKKMPLPRYYKDKIFKEEDPTLKRYMEIAKGGYKKKVEEEFLKKYWDEIERLGKLHPDPEAYYEHRLIEHHSRIRKKSLSLNKL